ncbi:MAG: phage head closure protein [Syntrophomonadaceae bacterium]|nr:phage head closure protein [Syntrophomonadaceae bacterium]
MKNRNRVSFGELRQRVSLQTKTITKAEGIPQENWTAVATVWAAIADLSGKEYFQAASIQSEVTTRIRIRFRGGINPAMRILNGTRVFAILSVIDKDERHREMELMCREVIPGGG